MPTETIISNRAEVEFNERVKARADEHFHDVRQLEFNSIENRAEQRRMMRRMQLERRDAKIDETLARFKEAEKFEADYREQQERLADEAMQMQRQAMVETKQRQKLRETSVELRDLEAKLRAAYALKELDAQVCAKQAMAVREKNNELRIAECMKGSWQQQKALEERQERQELIRKKQLRDELQNQMIQDEQKRQLQFEEFLREKRLVDEAIRRIHQEDVDEAIANMEKVQRNKTDIDNFRTAQAIWRKKERDRIEEENREIQKYLKKQEASNQAKEEEARLREEAKTKLCEKVGRQIFDIEQQKKERESILQVLAEEELLAAEMRRARQEIEKKVQTSRDLQEASKKQSAEKKARLDREAAEDLAARQALIADMAEHAKLEQLTKEKQHQKMMVFRREAEDIMALRKIQRAEELQRLLRQEEIMQAREKSYMQVVEDERLNMLKEHATKLLGFLPMGVLRESDLPVLGPEFVEYYKTKN